MQNITQLKVILLSPHKNISNNFFFKLQPTIYIKLKQTMSPGVGIHTIFATLYIYFPFKWLLSINLYNYWNKYFNVKLVRQTLSWGAGGTWAAWWRREWSSGWRSPRTVGRNSSFCRGSSSAWAGPRSLPVAMWRHRYIRYVCSGFLIWKQKINKTNRKKVHKIVP